MQLLPARCYVRHDVACAVINPDNSYEILIDQSSVKAGNLLEDME